MGAIIQARVGSTRLPGKVLLPLPANQPVTVLEHIIRRARAVPTLDRLIVATTTLEEDDPIESLCAQLAVTCFRGSKHDVLSRYYLAAREHGLDHIMRLTGDNPCISPALMNAVLLGHQEQGADVTRTKNYPLGTNLEILSRSALERTFSNASRPEDREHVTTYIYAHPDLFRLTVLEAEPLDRYPEIRLTLDTREDYTLLCTIFDFLSESCAPFGLREILDLMASKPWLAYINQQVPQKGVAYSLADELAAAVAILERHGLWRTRDLVQSLRQTVKAP